MIQTRPSLIDTPYNSTDPFYTGYSNKGPNPNDPAYIFGRVVLKPAIDSGIIIGSYIWNGITANFAYLNERLSTIGSLFPLAHAACTQGPIFSDQMNLGKKDVLTIDKKGQLSVVTKNEYDEAEPVQKALMQLAQSAGGFMSLSIYPNHLNHLINILIKHIQENTPPDQPIDIAFVFDTAISMGNEIREFGKNFFLSLDQAKIMSEKENRVMRFAMLEYRDPGALYLHRVNINFTEDINALKENAKKLTFMNGGTTYQASLNPLLAAKEGLAWNQEAKHAIILITDASPQPKTDEGVQTTGILTYPILTYQPSLMRRIN